jgi:hypothetical protein
VGFNDKVCHGFGIKVNFFLLLFKAVVPAYCPAPHTKFFKRKKRKKRKPFVHVEGFKKASFLDEILPEGWRFYTKPEGLELVFLNTCNIASLSFFYFLGDIVG